MENRTDLQKVQDIKASYVENSDQLIILDEVQRLPEIFASLRGIIDKERRKGNKADKQFVVYSGTDTFRMGEGVTTISLSGLMRELLGQHSLYRI